MDVLRIFFVSKFSEDKVFAVNFCGTAVDCETIGPGFESWMCYVFFLFINLVKTVFTVNFYKFQNFRKS